MQEIKNKIPILKRKLLVKEIISLLELEQYSKEIRCIEDDEVTLNNLRGLYKHSEKHKVKSFDLDNFNLDNVLNIINNINWNEEKITFFVFYKERLQIVLPYSIFLEKTDNIFRALYNMGNDIIFYIENFKHGVCFLYDEYSVSFYKW